MRLAPTTFSTVGNTKPSVQSKPVHDNHTQFLIKSVLIFMEAFIYFSHNPIHITVLNLSY